MFEAIKKLIEDYPRIIIHRHKNPDGDALGAQMGLKRILMENYPDKEIFAVGDMTPRYTFMATLPIDEIADKLGCSKSTVNKEIAAIKQELRQLLESEGYLK